MGTLRSLAVARARRTARARVEAVREAVAERVAASPDDEGINVHNDQAGPDEAAR